MNPHESIVSDPSADWFQPPAHRAVHSPPEQLRDLIRLRVTRRFLTSRKRNSRARLHFLRQILLSPLGFTETSITVALASFGVP